MHLRYSSRRLSCKYYSQTAWGMILAVLVLMQTGSCLRAQTTIDANDILFLNGPSRVQLIPPLEISESGIADSNGHHFPWQAVRSARLSNSTDQQKFVLLLQQVGEPLYLLDRRLKLGDAHGLIELCEKLEPFGSKLSQEDASLLALANLQGSSQNHQDEIAIMHWLNFLRVGSASSTAACYPESRISDEEVKSGMLTRIFPLFFDSSQARFALSQLDNSVYQLKESTTGHRVYRVALLLACDDIDEAQRQMISWPVDEIPALKEWQQIFALQIELQRGTVDRATLVAIENQLTEFSYAGRWVARFWLQVAQSASSTTDRNFRNAMLSWLEIAAESADRHPNFTAAALSHAQQLAEGRNWTFEASRIRSELIEKYRMTYFGKLAREKQ